MKLNPQQIELLAPYLEGDKPTHEKVDQDTGERTWEWNVKCPLHEDSRRSASINVDKGLFYCHAQCGGMTVTQLIELRQEWIEPSNVSGNGGQSKPT